MKKNKILISTLGILSPLAILPVAISCSESVKKYSNKEYGFDFNSKGEITNYFKPDKDIVVPAELIDDETQTKVKIKKLNISVSKKGITSLKMEEGLEEILGDFSDNEITELIIPSTVRYITKLESNFLFLRNKIKNIIFKPGSKLEKIDFYAFKSNQLTSLVLPNFLTTIGREAFSENKLTSLTLPNSVTIIDEDAFYGNYDLTSLTLPNSLVEIGDFAFYDCPISNQETLTIPKSVKLIGRSAFKSYKGSVVFEEIENHKIETIRPEAFFGAKNVILPKNLKLIGESSFGNIENKSDFTNKLLEKDPNFYKNVKIIKYKRSEQDPENLYTVNLLSEWVEKVTANKK